jgi:hypothetical protein
LRKKGIYSDLKMELNGWSILQEVGRCGSDEKVRLNGPSIPKKVHEAITDE